MITVGLIAIAFAILCHGYFTLKGLTMSELSTAVDGLVAQVQETEGKLDSAITYIHGVPDLIAAAVKDALAQAGVDEQTATAAVSSATQTIASETENVMAAIGANDQPPSQPTDTTTAGDPGAPTSTQPQG